jgi:hypothetical protein
LVIFLKKENIGAQELFGLSARAQRPLDARETERGCAVWENLLQPTDATPAAKLKSGEFEVGKQREAEK